MKIHIFITGSSKGIGKAIAEKALEEGINVTGLSRTNNIEHERFEHKNIDLSNLSETKEFDFRLYLRDKHDRIVFISNAGSLDPVGHLGKLNNDQLQKSIAINITSPAILMNNFASLESSAEKLCINVSSGAGSYPVDGWFAYCTAKSAINAMTEVGEHERENGFNNIRFLSVAPGIVDTHMQNQIRKQDKKDFSRVDEFINFKKTGALKSVNTVGEEYLDIILNPDNYKETQFRL